MLILAVDVLGELFTVKSSLHGHFKLKNNLRSNTRKKFRHIEVKQKVRRSYTNSV